MRKTLSVVSLLILCMVAYSTIASAQGSMEKGSMKKHSGSSTAMPTKYLIIAPHSKEECSAMMDKMAESDQKVLNTVWFGCMSGDHTAYAIVDAKDEEAARNMISKDMRDKAKIVKVNKFTPKMIKEMHKG